MADLTRKGVTFTEALLEAMAVAPIQRVVLYAYELWHPSLAEPVRFVNDRQDLSATLEDDAPRNGGETVEFLACPLSFERPPENDDAGAPKITLGRPDVSGLLNDALAAARESLVPWQLIERTYTSDDLSEPAVLPVLKLELDAAELSADGGVIVAGFDDETNVAVPAITFKRSEYPGLQR